MEYNSAFYIHAVNKMLFQIKNPFAKIFDNHCYIIEKGLQIIVCKKMKLQS